ncbi:hypothetical protein BDF19DRAFT_433652 [Syncephalis fuscata]|nr:hypothetical protein BDF19DRAFT_433652 [Syncephalis fuscata]
MLFHASQKVLVSIELQESAAVLRGNAEESVGTVLRGAVVVTVAEECRVRSISARFRGRMRLWWNKDGEPHHTVREEKRTLIERIWTFLPHGKHSHTMRPGVYRYAFEELLPGNLPETVCVEYGKVNYQILATVERPMLHHNHTAEREVRIERHLYPIPLDWLDTCQVSDVWQHRVAYSMSIPARAVGSGDVVPIRVEWQPEREDTRVRGVIFTLVEHVQYRPNHLVIQRDQRCVAQHSEKLIDQNGSGGSGDWSRTFFFRLPDSDYRHPTHRVQCDCRTTWIRVKHRLRVHVVFEDGLGAAKVYGIIPIVVLSQSPRNLDVDPPGYENYQRGALIMSAPVTPRPASIADDNDEDDNGTNDNDVGNINSELELSGLQRRQLRRTSSIPSTRELGRRAQAVSMTLEGFPALNEPSAPFTSYIPSSIPSWAGNFAALPSYESVIRHRQNSLPQYNEIVANFAALNIQNSTPQLS